MEDKAIVVGIALGIIISSGFLLGPLFEASVPLVQGTNNSTVRNFTLVADEMEVQITPYGYALGPGLMYRAMVFNGTVPGPVIAVHQGDTVQITLVNEGEVVHSLDFHSALSAGGANSGPVKAGESKTWEFKAEAAGTFFYHCSADGLNGVWEHIANGMFGGIVVHPQNEKEAKEFYLTFNQIYTNSTSENTTGSFDFNKFMTKDPDFVLTNGMAFKYACPLLHPIIILDACSEAEFFVVTPGELTRWHIINAGPNDGISFHFIGSVMDVRDGSIKGRYGTQDKMDETWWIPPGSASVIEVVFPEEGVYTGVDMEMTDFVKGGVFFVVATDAATDDDHPDGTMIPP